MRHRKIACASIVGAAAVALVAQQSATEAPAGFTTPTLGQTISSTGQLTVAPGSQSISNGIAEPPGDTFALDQAQFERKHDASTGLGPLFNATACVECHNNGVAGAASQFTEQRVGHNDANGNFVNPTITINEGANTITGRSIVNDRSICPQAQEHVPETETIRTLRRCAQHPGRWLRGGRRRPNVPCDCCQPALTDQWNDPRRGDSGRHPGGAGTNRSRQVWLEGPGSDHPLVFRGCLSERDGCYKSFEAQGCYHSLQSDHRPVAEAEAQRAGGDPFTASFGEHGGAARYKDARFVSASDKAQCVTGA